MQNAIQISLEAIKIAFEFAFSLVVDCTVLC